MIEQTKEKPEQQKLDKRQFYQASVETLITDLETDEKLGLTETVAKQRLEKVGYNKLKEVDKEPFWHKILAQFEDFTVIILIVAAIISGFTGDALEALIIIAIVIVNAILGVVQEGRAEKAVEALQKMTTSEAKVIRDGKLKQINAELLVPGDIVQLEAGDVVPADLRLLTSSNLKVEEAALTYRANYN